MKQILCKYKTNFVSINNTKNEYIVIQNLFYLAEQNVKCDRKEITNCYKKVQMLIKKYDQLLSVINSRLQRHSTRSSSLREFS